MVKKFDFAEIRTPMMMASGAQIVLSVGVIVVASWSIGTCTENRHGDWGMVYGATLFACSVVTGAAVYGRQRRSAVVALGLGVMMAITALTIDSIAYFCVYLRGGVNRNVGTCPSFIEKFNSCAWVQPWFRGTDHYDTAQPSRLVLLCFVGLHLVCSVGLSTSALSEAGKYDLCQFEEALRELNEANANLTYRKRARRNRILTQYIAQAKPEESQTYAVKMLRFFGFGTDVEPTPVAERKIKFSLPPGTGSPQSQ